MSNLCFPGLLPRTASPPPAVHGRARPTHRFSSLKVTRFATNLEISKGTCSIYLQPLARSKNIGFWDKNRCEALRNIRKSHEKILLKNIGMAKHGPNISLKEATGTSLSRRHVASSTSRAIHCGRKKKRGVLSVVSRVASECHLKKCNSKNMNKTCHAAIIVELFIVGHSFFRSFIFRVSSSCLAWICFVTCFWKWCAGGLLQSRLDSPFSTTHQELAHFSPLNETYSASQHRN